MSTKTIKEKGERKEELPSKNRNLQKVVDGVKTQGSYTNLAYSSQEARDSNHKRFHLCFIVFVTLIPKKKKCGYIKHMGY